MNTTTLLIVIIILIALYPFIVYYQLKTLKQKLDTQWSQIEKLLKAEPQNAERIHIERRAFNKLVRENNHKLASSLAQFIARKYDFTEREFFEFQGR